MKAMVREKGQLDMITDDAVAVVSSVMDDDGGDEVARAGHQYTESGVVVVT